MLDRIRCAYHYGRYKRVKALLPPERRRLLDIGCGNPCEAMQPGAFLHYLGYGMGVDLRHFRLPRFVQADVFNLPFGEGSFEVVVAMELLEYLNNPTAAVAEIVRVLTEDGLFLFTTLNTSPLMRFLWTVWSQTWGRMWQEYKLVNSAEDLAAICQKWFRLTHRETYLNVCIMMWQRNPAR